VYRTTPLTLREEHTLKVLEKNWAKEIFGQNREEVTVG
jgi:hypothetical protein